MTPKNKALKKVKHRLFKKVKAVGGEITFRTKYHPEKAKELKKIGEWKKREKGYNEWRDSLGKK